MRARTRSACPSRDKRRLDVLRSVGHLAHPGATSHLHTLALHHPEQRLDQRMVLDAQPAVPRRVGQQRGPLARR